MFTLGIPKRQYRRATQVLTHELADPVEFGLPIMLTYCPDAPDVSTVTDSRSLDDVNIVPYS